MVVIVFGLTEAWEKPIVRDRIRKVNSMREVTIAAIQMSCSRDVKENIEKAAKLIRAAAEAGAQIILLRSFLRDSISVRRGGTIIMTMQSHFLKMMRCRA